MRSHVRFSLLALVVSAIVGVSAPAAAQAAFGVENFFASNCNATHEGCKKPAKASEELQKAKEEGYTQAAGHPPFGITDFTLNTKSAEPEVPEGIVTHIRTDVAPGVSTNPQSREKCSAEAFGTKEAIAGTGLYAPPACGPESIIGTNTVVAYDGTLKKDVTLKGTVYNLEQPVGDASEFGVALDATNLGVPGLFAHTLIEGHVEYASDYHDYFEIKVSPALPLISSRLVFKGNIGTGGFLTNPSTCSGSGPQTTSSLHIESLEGASAASTYTTPIGIEGCSSLVPFEPNFSLRPGNTQQDEGNGFTAELSVPHNPSPEALDNSQLKTATVTLPEGMTLNPSAAKGLEACTPSQARIKSLTHGTSCPGGSKIGTVSLNVPGLPAGSLTGNVYLGGPESGPITSAPYTIYVDAESERYGLSVRLKGSVMPDEATGQVTTTFSENPEQPFTSFSLQFNGGALSPVANPLSCGTATGKSVLSPFTGTAAREATSGFTVDSNNSGGSCASTVPFSPTQSTPPPAEPRTGGAHTSFTFTLERSQGQQYLSHVYTVLPAGLVGAIPTVPLCSAAEANAGACSSASQIGAVNVLAGSGEPYSLSGSVYLTGPYAGAPYGMLISVPVEAGPFKLGNAVTRLAINVDQVSGRVIVSGYLPSIVHGGIPVRLRKATVSVTRQGFLSNPTNCGVLATESGIAGSLGTTVSLSTPFQAVNCNTLAFKPAFKAATSAHTSKNFGASLETTINEPTGANIKSVVVQLPKQLPSRLSTLQKACPEATFNANPLNCPTTSLVGGARANTPVLPNKLTGPAYLVSHGGRAFPDLDLILQADGVRVVLTGNTNIVNGVTTTTFASTPDVPVSSITVNLPVGAHSALAGYGSFCAQPLVMPTTITGQNGAVVKQNTILRVAGCGVSIVGHKVIGNTAYLTIRTFSAGHISGAGGGRGTARRYVNRAVNATTLKVSLRGHRRHVRLRVGFAPTQRGFSPSAAYVTVYVR